MTFRLDPWCNESGRLAGAAVAGDALASLRWSLSGFETPQPIAIDLSGVSAIADEFIEGFFGAIADHWPTSYFGPHAIVVVGVDAALAPGLRDKLHFRGFGVPVTPRPAK